MVKMKPGEKRIDSIHISPCENGCTVSLDCCEMAEGKEYESYINHRVNMDADVWNEMLSKVMKAMGRDEKPKTVMGEREMKAFAGMK